MTIHDFEKNLSSNIQELFRQGIPMGQISHTLRLHVLNMEFQEIAQAQAAAQQAQSPIIVPPTNGQRFAR